ncbi:MAG: hypothetical protein IJ869_07165 [Clostridiales bacterium]|nr:hypothetical protein [Clostridiales bacterium]
MFWNFFKSECYRASKLKSAYIIPAILLVVVLLVSFVLVRIDMYGLMGMSREDVDRISQEGSSAEGISDSFRMGFDAGIHAGEGMYYSEGDEELELEEVEEKTPVSIIGEGIFYTEDVPELFYQNVGTLVTILLLAIFTGIFFGDVYSTGITKNLTIANNRRSLLYGARLLVLACYTFLFHIFTLISVIISAALMAESVKLNFDRSFILYFLISWLMTFAFCLIVAAITTVTKSKAAGITVGVILASGFLTLAISIANLILVRLLDLEEGFDISRFMITENLVVINLHADGSDVLRAIIVSIIYGAAAALIGNAINRRRDLN